MKKPRQFSSSNYEDLSNHVPRNEYRVYNDRQSIPKPIRGVGGYSSSENHVLTILMASSTSSNPPNIGGITPASSSPIYKVLSIRKDIHSDGILHTNKDESLIFKDNRGMTFQMTATDKSPISGHFFKLAHDSELDIPLEVYKLPNKLRGKIVDLGTSVVQPYFSTGSSPINKKKKV